MSFRSKELALYLFIIGVILVVLSPFFWTINGQTIQGLYFNGQPVGKMNQQEVSKVLLEENQKLQKESVVLTYKGRAETWNYSSLKASYGKDTALLMMNTGREGNLLKQWWIRWKARLFGYEVKGIVSYDHEVLHQKADELVRKYSGPPKDPVPVFQSDGSVSFNPGRPHLDIDKNQLLERVQSAIASDSGETIEIPVKQAQGSTVKEEDLKGFNTVLGKYTTEFGGDANRSKNIQLAASKISGTVVKAGEVFSFNKTTGDRTANEGYYKAPVFMDGKLEDGDGGGVCQVSSTLFNAVLLSGMEVTQRVSHYEPVNYVPIGQDATVAYPAIDFCFRNDLKHDVYIYCDFEEGSLTIYILGQSVDKPQSVVLTKIKDEVIPFGKKAKIDPKQKEEKTVKEGHTGRYVLITEKADWKDGRTFKDQFESKYEPEDTVITTKQ